MPVTYIPSVILPSKYPFWSAIITQQAGSVSVPAGTATYLNIQPPAGETWLVEITAHGYQGNTTAVKEVSYGDFDGTTRREHAKDSRYNEFGPWISVLKILTNSLYARLGWYATNATTGYYGYSGFKLSQPLWSPKRLNDPAPMPWKKPASLTLPSSIAPLQKYAWDILGIDRDKPNDYALGIILEEDTPLAIDPATNFPIERLTVVVKADVLANFIAKFLTKTADPAQTGYRKYLDKWKLEGIDLGV